MIRYGLYDILNFSNAWWTIAEENAKTMPQYVARLMWLEKQAELLGLRQSVKLIAAILKRVSDSKTQYTEKQREEDTNTLQTIVEQELEDILFGFVPFDKVEYYENNELFGKEVNTRFPSIATEIKELGSCFALGRYTASVFHSMRVLEIGLRSLAKRLNATTTHPIDVADWGQILTGIERAIRTIESQPRTARRQKDLEFYHSAAAQFRHFKDAWRNHAMHSRVSYDETGAKIVMVHVKEFMQHIATRLKER